MSASVYQGESRCVPRWTMLVLLIKSCVEMVAMILFDTPGGRTRSDAPFWLRFPAEHKLVAVSLGLFTIFALVQFGLRRRPIAWGSAGLLVLVYLNESQAAFTGSEERMFFVCGALFAGWLFGVLFARSLDRRLARANDVRRDDELGEAGAAGAFAATYVGAFVSKLLASGLGWTEGTRLLSTIVGRHTFSGGALDVYVSFVLVHPGLATLFAMGTLVIEAGMVLYLVGPRLRMIWGALVFGLHLNIYLLMGVKYFVSMIIALAFSFPWPRIVRRLRGLSSERAAPAPLDPGETEALRPVTTRALGWIAAAFGAAIALWLGIHAHDPQRLVVEPTGHWGSSAPPRPTGGSP